MLPGKWKLRYRARGVLISFTSCQSETGIRKGKQKSQQKKGNQKERNSRLRNRKKGIEI